MHSELTDVFILIVWTIPQDTINNAELRCVVIINSSIKVTKLELAVTQVLPASQSKTVLVHSFCWLGIWIINPMSRTFLTWRETDGIDHPAFWSFEWELEHLWGYHVIRLMHEIVQLHFQLSRKGEEKICHNLRALAIGRGWTDEDLISWREGGWGVILSWCIKSWYTDRVNLHRVNRAEWIARWFHLLFIFKTTFIHESLLASYHNRVTKNTNRKYAFIFTPVLTLGIPLSSRLYQYHSGLVMNLRSRGKPII